MSANRLTRDQILLEALKMAEVPSLNQSDVSTGNPYTGTISAGAISIGWLQQYLDLFHGRFPWATTAKRAVSAFVAGTDTYPLPADFILDLKDGLFYATSSGGRRARRRGLQNTLSFALSRAGNTLATGAPLMYSVMSEGLLVAPIPDQAYPTVFWYYGLPPALTGSVVPTFPSDLVLIECVRIRAMELVRAAPPGAALAYAERQIVELRKSGLGHEPESEDIPLDSTVFIPGSGSRDGGSSGWMGETVL